MATAILIAVLTVAQAPYCPTGGCPEVIPTAEIGPAPDQITGQLPRILPRAPLNYGVNADKLNQETRRIRASDPETLRMINAKALKADAEDEKKRPLNPIAAAEWDIGRLISYAVSGLLFAAGLVVLILGRRSA